KRFTVEGPSLCLDPRRAVALSMALHELCTNAIKYGAMSTPHGSIAVRWRQETVEGEPRLHLTWQERGGPPVTPPTRRGFGSRLIERGLEYDLRGTVRLDFTPQGVVCHINAPLPRTTD